MTADTRKVVLFLHIPKTAGTTVDDVFKASDPSGHRRTGNVFKGGGGVDATQFSRIGNALADPNARSITGHVPLGGVSSIPTSFDIEYVTFLREPVDRAISHYYAQVQRGSGRGTDEKRLPPRLVTDPDSDRSDRGRAAQRLDAETPLDEAFSSLAYVPDNLQTRFLCGSQYPFGPVTDELLEAAKENLRSEFVVAGLTERLDESLVLLKRRLGLGAILFGHARSNSRRPRGDQIPAEVVEAATRWNRYDIELYRFACEQFAEAAKELDDLEAAVDLAAVRLGRNGTGGIDPPPDKFGGPADAWELVVRARMEALKNAVLAGRAVAAFEVALGEVERWHDRIAAKFDNGSGPIRPKRLPELERQRAQSERMLERLREEQRRMWAAVESPGTPDDE